MLKINTIYKGFDGEVNYFGQGHPTVFVRLQGCNLRCPYCDTKETWDVHTGTPMKIIDVVSCIKKELVSKVTITGGEPLLQSEELNSLLWILKPFYKITIETNGTIYDPAIWGKDWIHLVIDYKMDQPQKMNLDCFRNLSSNNFVKVMVRGIEEYQSFVEKEWFKLLDVGCSAKVAISPVGMNAIQREQLINMVVTSTPEWYLNFQIHKFVYNDPERKDI